MESLTQSLGSPVAEPKVESLVIGGGHAPSCLLLPSLAARFHKTHPRLRIYLRNLRRDEVEQMVLKGAVEIAVATSSHARSGELTSELYRRERLVFFARFDDPLAKRRNLKRKDLRSIPLVTRSRENGGGTMEKILRQLEAQGIRLNIVMHCEKGDTVKACVREGMRVGLLYRDHVKPEIESGQFREIKISGLNLAAQSYIIYRKETPLPRHAEDFLKLLRESRGRG